MTEKKLSKEVLEAQEGSALADKEAMSVLVTVGGLTDGGVLPVQERDRMDRSDEHAPTMPLSLRGHGEPPRAAPIAGGGAEASWLCRSPNSRYSR